MTHQLSELEMLAVGIALDRVLGNPPKGGPRSHVLRLGRDVLLPVCIALANPMLTSADVFERLERDLAERGERSPGRSGLYRFAQVFAEQYGKVRDELNGAHMSPLLAALPLPEVGRRLCLSVAQVESIIGEGRLRAIELAGEKRVPLECIQTLLAGGRS